MDPAIALQAFWGLLTATCLAGLSITPLRKSLIDYGSRAETPKSAEATPAANASQSKLASILEYLGSFQVPHSWFVYYYVTSVASSVFWGWQLWTRGSAFQLLASYTQQPAGGGMNVDQVFLVWFLMAIQGCRRLYEDLTLGKPSQSKMGVHLWALGIGYYIAMGISIWIEGISALESHAPLRMQDFAKPSLKTKIAIPIFLLATGFQHDCHVYLASLKKYTLPQHPLFEKIVSPHYTAECFIYVALAIIAAPEGQMVNKTILAGLSFVVANLGGTAHSSRKWYVQKFGEEQLRGRWRMVPYVY